MEERTPNAAYREGSRKAIERVLEKVRNQAEKRVRDGFNEFNFTIGVLNCFFLSFMFCEYPQNLWIVYIVQALYFSTAKFRIMIKAKPLNQGFYYLDLCWVMNFVGVIALILLFIVKEGISDNVGKQFFYGAFGIACGPLQGSTPFLSFLTLVFHNLESMTSVFVHFCPSLLLYILRWESATVKEAWPDLFSLDYEIAFWPPQNGNFTNCVFGNAVLFYFAWFIPYFLWQVFIGLDLHVPIGKQSSKTDHQPQLCMIQFFIPP